MSAYSPLRLFFRMEKPGKLPLFGNVGILYTSSIMQTQHTALTFGVDRKNRKAFQFDTFNRFKIPIYRWYSTAVSTTDVLKSDAAREGVKKRTKTTESPKIMLISETKAVSVVTLEEAHKIALHKNLHLVPDNSELAKLKTEKAVYKLITNAEFLKLTSDMESSTGSKDFRNIKEDKKKDREKEFKTVILKSKAAENDVLSKVKQMIKWIEKGHYIRVMIGQSGEHGDAEHIFKCIESHMKETGAKFLQKTTKGNQVRFQIVPPKDGQPQSVKKHKGKESSSSEETDKT